MGGILLLNAEIETLRTLYLLWYSWHMTLSSNHQSELNGVLFIMMTYCPDVTCIKVSFFLILKELMLSML